MQADGEAVCAGYRHREIRSLLGMRIEQTLEVIAYDPPERLDLEVVEARSRCASRTCCPETDDGETQIPRRRRG